jgi:hypothetical protein
MPKLPEVRGRDAVKAFERRVGKLLASDPATSSWSRKEILPRCRCPITTRSPEAR